MLSSRNPKRRDLNFESYGVRISVETNVDALTTELKDLVRSTLVNNVRFDESTSYAEHSFFIGRSNDKQYFIKRDNEEIYGELSLDSVLELFVRMLRLKISEHAVDHVFVHAGVVGWNGQAIILPGESGSGKTSLVIELVRLGAEYYSDEYAVIDEKGLVHPFARKLSVKNLEQDWSERNGVPIEAIGGRAGISPIPIGLVALTTFAPGPTAPLQEITRGNGMIETFRHAIPLQIKPEFVLKVLKTALSRAIILKGLRGEANLTAKNILSFFDFDID